MDTVRLWDTGDGEKKGKRVREKVNIQLSSPSKMPGMPTRSRGMPSSASASMFKGCSRAIRDAKAGVVYWPLDRPVLGISRSFGGIAGGGSAFEYRIRAMKSWWMTLLPALLAPPDDDLNEELIVTVLVGRDGKPARFGQVESR
jgi:hypothetical protein